MTTRRARSTASSGLMLPVVIQGLVCLALLLVFHVSIGLDPIAPLRLAETRLSFLVHLVCNTAFVATLWHLARNRHTFLRLAIFPPLVWLLFVGLSAASSPIPAAAFEQWMFWLDAALLFYVGQVLISRRPDIFFLLFAFLGNLMAVVVLRIALANPRQVPPEYVLAISIALSLAAILVIIGRRPMNQQRSFLRFLLMVAVLLGMGALLKAFAPQTGGAPEMVALGHVIRLRPWTGSGIGAISQVLPSFAAQDYGWLLMPSNSWIVLRAEVGWLGLTLLWAGIMVAVGRLLVIFHDHEGDGSSFMAFGMAGVILLLVVGSFWHGFLSLPFGRLLLFLLLGTAGGFMMPRFAATRAARPAGRAGLGSGPCRPNHRICGNGLADDPGGAAVSRGAIADAGADKRQERGPAAGGHAALSTGVFAVGGPRRCRARELQVGALARAGVPAHR